MIGQVLLCTECSTPAANQDVDNKSNNCLKNNNTNREASQLQNAGRPWRWHWGSSRQPPQCPHLLPGCPPWLVPQSYGPSEWQSRFPALCPVLLPPLPVHVWIKQNVWMTHFHQAKRFASVTITCTLMPCNKWHAWLIFIKLKGLLLLQSPYPIPNKPYGFCEC